LWAAGRFSVEDGPGSKVAVLMPFVKTLVQDARDDYDSFERDADALVRHIEASGREPIVKMRATTQDFATVLADRSVASVVLRGFGSLSAVAASEDVDDAPHALIDWVSLARMADHLKLGKFVMRTCGGATRLFNPPLACGVVSSYKNIWAPVGRVIHVAGLDDDDNKFIRPVTDKDELTYDEIYEEFPLQRHRNVPKFVPNPLYFGVRALHNHIVDTSNLHLVDGTEPKA
jgi:hypothetical protein